MNIAIIGSGISGLSAAFQLAPHANVTIFEADSRLGGHANTVHAQFSDAVIPVDTGFMVFNPGRYPNFCRLLEYLDVHTIDTTMSFSVSLPSTVEYSSNLLGILGDIRQLCSVEYWKFLQEIIRYNKAAKQFIEQKKEVGISIAEFIDLHQLSNSVANWYIYPMIGSIWSSSTTSLQNFSAYETFKFLDNHNLFNVLNKPQWKTIKGGSIQYVSALEKRLIKEGVKIIKNSPVTSVTRSTNSVQVSVDAEQSSFDYVVFATHANDTLRIIDAPNNKEHEALTKFTYAENKTVLHSDTSYMPARSSAWAAWNYIGDNEEGEMQKVSLSYNMNILQDIPKKYPLFVTLNPAKPIAEEHVHGTYSYSHPHLITQARIAQNEIRDLQGQNNTFYTGAHLGYGFHEDGVASTLDMLQVLDLPNRLAS